MGYWGVVLNNLKNADIILLVLDARVPEETRNKEIETKASILGTKILYVFNKSDLVNKGTLSDLKKANPEAFFTNSNKLQTLLPISKYLNEMAEGRSRALRVAVLGYPNVGKSSILNKLTKSKEKVSRVSGTTKKTKWVRVGNVRFMDTPGVIPRKDSRASVGLTSSKDIYKIEHPERIALKLIDKIRGTNSLQNRYGVKINKEDTSYDIFLKIGIEKKHMIKGGDVDEDKTARVIVGDWQKGRLKV